MPRWRRVRRSAWWPRSPPRHHVRGRPCRGDREASVVQLVESFLNVLRQIGGKPAEADVAVGIAAAWQACLCLAHEGPALFDAPELTVKSGTNDRAVGVSRHVDAVE